MPEADGASKVGSGGRSEQRLDKWLWFCRVVKSRTQASALVSGGKVRVNRLRTDKPSYGLKLGDVVTVNVGRHVRVLRVLEPGHRRGPASEAALLYEDLTPREPRNEVAGTGERLIDGSPRPATRAPGEGRPTKRERRKIDAFRGRE